MRLDDKTIKTIKELGEIKIDIVINDINFNKKNYIYEVAKKTGIALN